MLSFRTSHEGTVQRVYLAGSCVVLLVAATVVHAQESLARANLPAGTIIPAGIPLRVVLERRVPIKRVGEPVEGRLMAPIYVYDRMVLPAGNLLEGRVAAIAGIPLRTRLRAILSGNLTPRRKASAQFDTLVLADGSRLPLQTVPSQGSAEALVIAKLGKKQPGQTSEPRDAQARGETIPAGIRALKAPGKMARLKDALLSRLPYHRQAWAPGTLFSGVLQDSLPVPASNRVETPAGIPAAWDPEGQDVSARLLTPINSASAHRGTPVEAVVTRPQFSADHRLLIPEGSRLRGEVTEAKPARWWHRNGKLLFVFREIELSPGAPRTIQGFLEGLQADVSMHLAIDSEGSAHATSPKSRFIFPALATAVAGLSLHQDYNSEGVPDQDIGGRAESGAVGLGLIGTGLAQASRTFASCIAFTGAGFSIYSTFIARGQNVVLAVNTPVEISIRRAGEAAVGRR
jgi:hypothetical protein